MRKPGYEQIGRLIQRGISEGIFPGVVVCIAESSKIFYHEAFGDRMIQPERKPMYRETVFDLASLTKPIVAATLIMRLTERGNVDLHTPVQNYLPEFAHPHVTILHLLTHMSGFPAWRATYLEAAPKDEIMTYLSRLPLENPAGTTVIYSCLGYILLGKLIEQLTGKPLDYLAQEWIFRPLDMNWTCYNPPAEWVDLCAATEDSSSFEKRMVNYQRYDWREGVIVGEVHDENAHFLGGVAGNAGLFSTCADLARFCQMLIDGGNDVLTAHSIKQIASVYTPGLNESRGLGWIILEDGSLYHTGFTGTSIRVNLDRGLFAILLTNRVHPDTSQPGIVDFRAKFYQSIFA